MNCSFPGWCKKVIISAPSKYDPTSWVCKHGYKFLDRALMRIKNAIQTGFSFPLGLFVCMELNS